jgi:hypothetical protein
MPQEFPLSVNDFDTPVVPEVKSSLIIVESETSFAQLRAPWHGLNVAHSRRRWRVTCLFPVLCSALNLHFFTGGLQASCIMPLLYISTDGSNSNSISNIGALSEAQGIQGWKRPLILYEP